METEDPRKESLLLDFPVVSPVDEHLRAHPKMSAKEKKIIAVAAGRRFATTARRAAGTTSSGSGSPQFWRTSKGSVGRTRFGPERSTESRCS